MIRLWHWRLIEFLPDSQLCQLFKDVKKIFEKKPHHFLFDYIYEYPEEDLFVYSIVVVDEMKKRHFRIPISFIEAATSYFSKPISEPNDPKIPFLKHQDYRYLYQCNAMLQECHDRHQPDYTDTLYEKLSAFMIDFTHRCAEAAIQNEEDNIDETAELIRQNVVN